MILTDRDRRALAALILAHAERRAERIKYADYPLLAELRLIGEGPGGWAYTFETRSVEQVEADLEQLARDNAERAARPKVEQQRAPTAHERRGAKR